MRGVGHRAWWLTTLSDVLWAIVLVVGALALSVPAVRVQGFVTIWFGALLIGVLVLIPPRRWWPYLLLGLPATYFAMLQGGLPPLNSGIRAVTDMAFSAGIAWLLQRAHCLPMRRRRDAWILFGLAGGIAVGRLVVGLLLVVLLPWPGGLVTLIPYFYGMSTLVGVIIAVPFVVLVFDHGLGWGNRRSATWVGVVAILGIAAISALAFVPGLGDWSLALMFMVIPLVVWLAARFSQRSLAIGLAVAGVGIANATVRGLGPFARPGDDPLSKAFASLDVQAFLGTVAVACWLLAAAVWEGRQAQGDLEE